MRETERTEASRISSVWSILLSGLPTGSWLIDELLSRLFLLFLISRNEVFLVSSRLFSLSLSLLSCKNRKECDRPSRQRRRAVSKNTDEIALTLLSLPRVYLQMSVFSAVACLSLFPSLFLWLVKVLDR